MTCYSTIVWQMEDVLKKDTNLETWFTREINMKDNTTINGESTYEVAAASTPQVTAVAKLLLQSK